MSFFARKVATTYFGTIFSDFLLGGLTTPPFFGS